MRRTDLEGTVEIVADGRSITGDDHRIRLRVASAHGVPGRDQALQILGSLGLPAGIVVHSRGVARVAAEAARMVAAAGIPVDIRLVEVAALLHDIDKPETRGAARASTAQVAADQLTADGLRRAGGSGRIPPGDLPAG